MSGRFDRQIPLFGEEGQRKLAAVSVGVAGCGGLGTNVVTALASAGIGEIVMVDGDSPDITNLNRQYVYREGSEGTKAELLAQWAMDIDPEVRAVPFPDVLDGTNVEAVFGDCDILVDCLDSISARFILNSYAVSSGKTLVHAGVTGLSGQVTVVVPGRTPCLGCLYGDIVESKAVKPSLGAAVSAVGSAEALQVIQLVTGIGEPLVGRMLFMDLSANTTQTVPVKCRPGCPFCGFLSSQI